MLSYNIYMNPKDFKTLRQDIWSDEYISGTLWIGGDKYAIDVSYRGHSIRNHEKKSYNILFKKPFFMNGAHEIHLNAEFNDPSLIRNKLSLDFFSDIGVLSPQSQHILLYINGVFNGIYLQLESFDQYLLTKRKLPDGSIYYATDNDANFSLLTAENEVKADLTQGYSEKYGNEEGKASLLNLLIKVNTLTDAEFYEEISKIINIEKYLLWLAGVVCTQNFDGFVHNYALYRDDNTKLYEITPWDYDGTWGRDRHGTPLEYDYIPIDGYNTLTARLFKYPHYRSMYKNIMESVLQNQFTAANQGPCIELSYRELNPYIIKDPYMKYRVEEFEKEPEFILEFIRNRNHYLTNELSRIV